LQDGAMEFGAPVTEKAAREPETLAN